MNAAFNNVGGSMRPVGPSSVRLVTPDAAITIDTVFVSNLTLTNRPDQMALIFFFLVEPPVSFEGCGYLFPRFETLETRELTGGRRKRSVFI